MKKIWLMMLLVCSVCAFPACSDDDDDDVSRTNPVSECTVPQTAEIGTEVTVTGKGFAQTAQLFLRNAENQETKVNNATFTASGATFTIPMGLATGEYTLVLKQEGTYELGKITLTAASLPVIDLEIPVDLPLGKSITIGGNGFDQACRIYLESTDNQRIELTITDRTAGLVCSIPASLTAGSYKLILAQQGGEWVLAQELNTVVVKHLTGISMSMLISDIDLSTFDEMMGIYTDEEMMEIMGMSKAELKAYIESMNNEEMILSSYVLNYSADQLKYIAREGMEESPMLTFEYEGNQIKGTNPEENTSFSLTVEEGRVTGSTAVYSATRSGSYNWNYEDGYLTGLYSVTTGKAYKYCNFKDGNFMSYGDGDGSEIEDFYRYENKELKNHPYAVDVAMAIQAFTIDEAQFTAILLGLTGKKSANLPTYLVETEQPMTCVPDAEGYIKEVKMTGTGLDPLLGMFPAKNITVYKFIYE